MQKYKLIRMKKYTILFCTHLQDYNYDQTSIRVKILAASLGTNPIHQFRALNQTNPPCAICQNIEEPIAVMWGALKL